MFTAAILLLATTARAETVREAFPPPSGATRVETDGFGDFLGQLQLRSSDVPVRTHDGRRVGHNARVVSLPMVSGDLQQCADSAIRLHAEWKRSSGQTDIQYYATSGDPIPWERFKLGERPYVKDGRISWRSSDHIGSWDAWLRAVFTWAGTRSLSAYETTPTRSPRAGDVLVEGGSPGHAVVLLDVAQTATDTFVLVGEGFMPAQDFHVELGPHEGWWRWTSTGLKLSHWHMKPEHLRRWK